MTRQCGERRRSLLVAFVLLSLAGIVDAQRSEPVRRIAFLGMDSGMQATRIAAFRDEMRKLGYVEGENLVIETRWAQGRFDRLPALAEELVAQKPEVIVTAAPPPVAALQKATRTIPIVMSVHNPVGQGFVASLARPGGNITGIAFQDSDLSVKRLDLFRGVVPNLTRVAIRVEPGGRRHGRGQGGGARRRIHEDRDQGDRGARAGRSSEGRGGREGLGRAGGWCSLRLR